MASSAAHSLGRTDLGTLSMSGPQWAAAFAQVGQKPAAPPAGDPGIQARKRLAIEDGTSEKKLDIALKLGVINSQRNRLLEAACTTQFTLKVADPIYQAMKNAHDNEYLPRVKGRKGHGLGAPDSFMFMGVALTLMPRASEEQQAVLRKYFDAFVPGSQPSQLLIKLFRTEKMYDAKVRRLMIAINDPMLEQTVVQLLIASKEEATAFTGPRPAGYLELEGQGLISA